MLRRIKNIIQYIFQIEKRRWNKEFSFQYFWNSFNVLLILGVINLISISNIYSKTNIEDTNTTLMKITDSINMIFPNYADDIGKAIVISQIALLIGFIITAIYLIIIATKQFISLILKHLRIAKTAIQSIKEAVDYCNHGKKKKELEPFKQELLEKLFDETGDINNGI